MTEGAGRVDESMITGEPIPVTKTRGRRLIGATHQYHRLAVMRAEQVGADTVLSQIVQIVAQAQRSRAPMQRMADWWRLLVRARRGGRRAGHLPGVGPLRTGARMDLRR